MKPQGFSPAVILATMIIIGVVGIIVVKQYL
jgi:hypothetical protein